MASEEAIIQMRVDAERRVSRATARIKEHINLHANYQPIVAPDPHMQRVRDLEALATLLEAVADATAPKPLQQAAAAVAAPETSPSTRQALRFQGPGAGEPETDSKPARSRRTS